MENLNMFVGQYIGVICVVLLGLLFFSIGIGCGLRSRMSELQKNMTSLPRVKKPI